MRVVPRKLRGPSFDMGPRLTLLQPE